MDGELANDGLTRTGGRTDQHAVTAFEGLTRLDLERVEPKRQQLGELGEARPRGLR
jgi:hypothetical protein